MIKSRKMSKPEGLSIDVDEKMQYRLNTNTNGSSGVASV